MVSVVSAVGLLDPYWLFFHYSRLFKFGPEIWRPITACLLTFKTNIIFLPYAIWSYGVPLERDSPRFTSASMMVYLLFIATCIIVCKLSLTIHAVYTHKVLEHSAPRIICSYSPSLAVAFPGTEEDYPHALQRPIIRNQNRRSLSGWEWWDVQLRMTTL